MQRTIAIVLATLITTAVAAATPDTQQPNVILIMTDDQGYGDREVSFTVDLHSGPDRLETFMTDANGVVRGAYFACVELLDNAASVERYEADWDSLAKAPVPSWWENGKFGIFIHWGPYSVAGYKYKHRGYAEAITRDLYANPQNYVDFMTEKFGAAPPEFGYKDMVPLFKAEKWDPAAWARLFQQAGARYVIPTAEHHDGYALWDSKLTPWCATKKGPIRDLVGELAKAVRAEGLKYGVSYHRERHPGRFAPKDTVFGRPHDQVAEEIRRMPEAASLYGPFEYSDAFIADYVARWKELQRQYKPDFMWLDDIPIFRSGEGHAQIIRYEEAIKGMIADYFNAAKDWGKDVWVNNKGKTPNWPVGVGCLEADNLKLAKVGPRWQNPATLGTSYAYMEAEEVDDLYKSPTELIRLLCDVVSKNGNLLLNIGPRADGTIPESVQARLLAMGEWLKVNGEAIYGSTYWKTHGEHEGAIIDEPGVHYNKHSLRIHQKEYRFTKKPGAIYVMSFQLDTKPFVLKSFTEKEAVGIREITCLASGSTAKWRMRSEGLELSPPRDEPFRHVAVYKIHLK